jgi:cell division protein FtsB
MKRRRRYQESWMKRLFLENRLFSCVCFVLLVVFIRLFTPVVSKKQELQQEIDVVDHHLSEGQLRISQLEKSIDQLQNDPEHIERLARQKLGLVREEEIVYAIVKTTGS